MRQPNNMAREVAVARRKGGEQEIVPLRELFKAYCAMDPVSSSLNVELLPLTQSDKWLTAARILDMVKLTNTDTGVAFFKYRKRAISFDEYLDYLMDLAKTKNLDFEDMKRKMQRCGIPTMTRKSKNADDPAE